VCVFVCALCCLPSHARTCLLLVCCSGSGLCRAAQLTIESNQFGSGLTANRIHTQVSMPVSSHLHTRRRLLLLLLLASFAAAFLPGLLPTTPSHGAECARPRSSSGSSSSRQSGSCLSVMAAGAGSSSVGGRASSSSSSSSSSTASAKVSEPAAWAVGSIKQPEPEPEQEGGAGTGKAHVPPPFTIAGGSDAGALQERRHPRAREAAAGALR
jgi:hypothetical protein